MNKLLEFDDLHYVTDKWFRLLEFSIIIAIIGYFMVKTNGLVLKLVFNISWVFVFAWIMTLSKQIGGRLNFKSTPRLQLFQAIISLFLTFGLLILVGTVMSAYISLNYPL